VVGIVESQAQAARRFSRAQIGNFQRRLESLHAGPPAGPATAGHGPGGPVARAMSATAADGDPSGIDHNRRARQQGDGCRTGASPADALRPGRAGRAAPSRQRSAQSTLADPIPVGRPPGAAAPCLPRPLPSAARQHAAPRWGRPLRTDRNRRRPARQTPSHRHPCPRPGEDRSAHRRHSGHGRPADARNVPRQSAAWQEAGRPAPCTSRACRHSQHSSVSIARPA